MSKQVPRETGDAYLDIADYERVYVAGMSRAFHRFSPKWMTKGLTGPINDLLSEEMVEAEARMCGILGFRGTR